MSIEELYDIFLEHPVVTTDSRDCPEGSIFFALKGETFNGNAYAQSAIEKGCSFAVVDEPAFANSNRTILVDDVLQTLQKLANHHRRQLGTRIIGITGTNGKTTTKELISCVLKKKYNTLYTQGNFNNHIGVPKTLLRLTSDHEIAVVEMGANHPGEIRDLVNIVEPDFGLITNVGKAHLLGFGSFEGVISTKGELYDFMRKNGRPIFINNDNPHLKSIANGLSRIAYGQEEAEDLAIKGTFISASPFLKFEWKTNDSERTYTVSTQLIGAYNIDNALAAVAVGTQFGVAPADICDALEEYAPSNNRSQLKRTDDNTLIIDAYNANPTSMAAALTNFRIIEAERKMCILGDMKELGESSLEEHTKILKLLDNSDFDNVWLVGSEFGKALETHKCNKNDIITSFNDVAEVNAHITDNKPKGFTILIKGSNSTRLIETIEHL